MRSGLFVFCLLFAAQAAFAQVRHITVDGSIQAAIDSIPAGNHERVVVHVPDGEYNERVRIDHDRVTLRGESRDGVVLRMHFPRDEYHKRYDRIGPAVLNLFGDDCLVQNLTVDNTATEQGHAFAIYGQPNRLITTDMTALGGGDTCSLWNTAHGMYYHAWCHFRGEVDFLCPRGWCYTTDCTFDEIRRTAAIWHDGHLDTKMKFVLRSCRFEGVEDFWLGRNHYPSQFYLLECSFADEMADRPIGTVKDLSNVPEEEHYLWERKYFHGCHRDSGDYAWHADNLDEAEGSPTPDEITPAWTFDGKWDPESTEPPRVEEVLTEGDRVFVRFSEPVAGATESRIVRADGTVAEYAGGDGAARLVYAGGSSDSAPGRLEPGGEETMYGCTATLEMRFVGAIDLPPAEPRVAVTWSFVGDSTVADYADKSALQGWAWGVRAFVDERVTVENHARNGRSSLSFRTEGRWEPALASSPAVVFIQFGHNDNLGKGPGRETDPAPGGAFRANLTRYVEEAREAGALAVLVTPPQRRKFDENGRIITDGPNAPYAAACRAVAEETGAVLIDLNESTRLLFNGLGKETSDRLQTPGDQTHFSPMGARRLAAIVLKELVEQRPELATYVVLDRLARP